MYNIRFDTSKVEAEAINFRVSSFHWLLQK